LLAQKLGNPIVILQIMIKPTSRAFKKGVLFMAVEFFLTSGATISHARNIDTKFRET